MSVTTILSPRASYVFDLFLCVIGIVWGIAGAVSFGKFFVNLPAALWSGISGCLAFVCFAQTVVRHEGLLVVLFTPTAVRGSALFGMLSSVASAVLMTTHLAVAINNREAFSARNIGHSDYLLFICSLMTLKYSVKLRFSSIACHKQLLYEAALPVSSRCSSPYFIVDAGHAPNAVQGRPGYSVRSPSCDTRVESLEDGDDLDSLDDSRVRFVSGQQDGRGRVLLALESDAGTSRGRRIESVGDMDEEAVRLEGVRVV